MFRFVIIIWYLLLSLMAIGNAFQEEQLNIRRCKLEKERKTVPLSCWKLIPLHTGQTAKKKSTKYSCTEEEVRRLSRKELAELIHSSAINSICLAASQKEKRRKDYVAGEPPSASSPILPDNSYGAILPFWWREN